MQFWSSGSRDREKKRRFEQRLMTRQVRQHFWLTWAAADTCFNGCVYALHNQKLSDKELLCVEHCSEKFERANKFILETLQQCVELQKRGVDLWADAEQPNT